MKKILSILLVIISFNASAQIDSATQVFANTPITVRVPVKAVVLYANYLSETPSWADRKAPDYLQTIIGSGTKPDSLVTVTLTANQLATFAIRMIAERYGANEGVNRSIFNNQPAITGYTALFSQVTTIANGVGCKKAQHYLL